MRWGVLFVVLAGCFQAGGILDDRGELSPDIAAPAPGTEPPNEDLDVVSAISGRVLSATGNPVAAATVWADLVDLREPENNLHAYHVGRLQTLTQTDANGRFSIPFAGEVYAVAARAPGFLISRAEPGQDIVLVSDAAAIIAHRGASYYAPENTLAAIDKAAWLGANWVELDVRLTVDGRLVIIHDPDTTRVTDRTWVVENSTWTMLSKLDAGRWFDDSFRGQKIPTLSEALRRAEDLGLQVILDVKASRHHAAATREALAHHLHQNTQADVMVAAFRKATVRYCVEEGLSCAYIANGTLDGWASLELAKDLGAQTLLLNHTGLEPRLRATAEAKRMQLFAWTANIPEHWFEHAETHGFITDRPAHLVAYLQDQP